MRNAKKYEKKDSEIGSNPPRTKQEKNEKKEKKEKKDKKEKRKGKGGNEAAPKKLRKNK